MAKDNLSMAGISVKKDGEMLYALQLACMIRLMERLHDRGFELCVEHLPY